MTLPQQLTQLSALHDQERELTGWLNKVRKERQSQEQALAAQVRSMATSEPVTTLVSPTGHVYQWNEDDEDSYFFLLARPAEVLLFTEDAQEADHVRP